MLSEGDFYVESQDELSDVLRGSIKSKLKYLEDLGVKWLEYDVKLLMTLASELVFLKKNIVVAKI